MMRQATVMGSLLALLVALTAPAQFDLDEAASPLDTLDGGLEMTLEEGPATVDLSGLAQSCYLPLVLWQHVQPADRAVTATAPDGWRWQRVGGDAVPLQDSPISTRIAVPVAGVYRLFLRERLAPDVAAPVRLLVRPVTAAGAGEPMHDYTYGATALDSTMTGDEHQRRRPLVFESETTVLGMVARPTWVWEYTDVTLAVGTYELSLASSSRSVCLTGLLLTQATGFRPSLDDFPDYNTMDKVYVRFRVREAEGAAQHTAFTSVGYHWRGRVPKGGTVSIWGWNIGGTSATTTGEWTEFLDATEAMIPGPGPWGSSYVTFAGIDRGEADVEYAWRPEASAVMLRVSTATAGGSALVRVPHGSGLGVDGTIAPAWGVWRDEYRQRFLPESAIVAGYFSWAKDAMAALGLPADHPKPHKIVINTSARTTPAYNDKAAEMLAVLGVNWIQGASPAVVDQYGLVDGHWMANTADYEGAYAALKSEADKVYRVKVGDEIGTFIDSGTVNSVAYLLAGFHDYLRSQAATAGMTMPEFLGVSDVSQLSSSTELPTRAGVYERRLFYHSNVYAHLASAAEYKPIADGFHRRFPNIEVYNNYSPHPLFLTGATMNHSDWFVLCRNQAQTLGWAEDWAYYGGWDLGTAYQCTSFYAAMVAAGTRRHGYPNGFYVGTNCGGSSNKMFACVAQGATRLHLYDWGPIDGWPEGSNAWSENQGEYLSVARAAHALGPADTIIVDGERQPSRVAILYNRSHEIWQGGLGRMNHDWMWTYIAANGASEPVDVVIEDDLIGHIDQYKLLVLGGLNLEPRHLAAVADWVRAGNTLVLTSGAAMYDNTNDLNPAAVALSGVRQLPVEITDPDRRPVTFTESAVSPAATFAATFHGHQRFASFEPVDATVIATWPDGSPAAAVRDEGKGRVISLAFLPGHSFRDNGQWAGPEQAWLTGLLRRALGEPIARLSISGAETTAFSHDSGIAVLVNIYHPPTDMETIELTVATDRPITSVASALTGKLAFKKVDGRIVVTLPTTTPVDTVILR